MKVPCKYPGCPEAIRAGERFCGEHKNQAWKDRVKRTGAEGKKANRFYSSKRWRALREKVLSEEPFCRHCKEKDVIAESEEVDHIDGNRNNNSIENLQPLCKPCHSAKTMRDLKGLT